MKSIIIKLALLLMKVANHKIRKECFLCGKDILVPAWESIHYIASPRIPCEKCEETYKEAYNRNK